MICRNGSEDNDKSSQEFQKMNPRISADRAPVLQDLPFSRTLGLQCYGIIGIQNCSRVMSCIIMMHLF